MSYVFRFLISDAFPFNKYICLSGGLQGLFPKVQLFYTKRVPGKCMHAVHMLFLGI
jgi:hypothetical protein